MKKLSVLSLLLVVCMLFSACGASKTVMEEMKEMETTRGDYFYSSSTNGSVMTPSIPMADDMLMDGGAIEFGSATGSTVSTDIAFKEEKLIYTSRVVLETEEFDTATDALHATIKSLGGIIISENAYNLNGVNRGGYRNLSMTVRIPQENYDAFLSGISESYNVASIQNSVENLTERYYDNENRLKSYRIQEERLFAMLEKAENVSEMLEIEARLCDVQYQIEALTNTQTTIDNDVKYSTFYLDLNEVTKFTSPAPKTFGDRLVETLKDSGEMFAEFLEGALFTLIILAPYIAIAGVIAIVAVCTFKHKKKKAAAKKEKQNEN